MGHKGTLKVGQKHVVLFNREWLCVCSGRYIDTCVASVFIDACTGASQMENVLLLLKKPIGNMLDIDNGMSLIGAVCSVKNRQLEAHG